MNVLNRSGAIVVFEICFMISCLLRSYAGLSLITHDFPSLPTLFLLCEYFRFYKKNDWYVYKFYPVDFFDRNAHVVIVVLDAVILAGLRSFLWIAIYCMAAILNELLMRKYYKYRIKKDQLVKELLGQQDYDGEKIVLKTINKNFFVRNTPFFLVLVFLWFALVMTHQAKFYFLSMIAIIVFAIYEEFVHRKRIKKEIEKILENIE
ncbi:hypothetical protein J6Z19_05660 [bacterium]|nr:hypothetical protein [bacterium]